MKRHLFLPLTLGLLTAGFSAMGAVQAQTVNPPETDPNVDTLSGESLQSIETRSTSGDFQNFFRGNAPGQFQNSGIYSISTPEPSNFELEGLEVVVDDYRESEVSGERDEQRKVRVQIPVE